LKGDELKAVSGLIVLDPTHEIVEKLTHGGVHVERGKVWWENPSAHIGGVAIGKALVLACRKPDA
jgi:hypothetical protein